MKLFDSIMSGVEKVARKIVSPIQPFGDAVGGKIADYVHPPELGAAEKVPTPIKSSVSFNPTPTPTTTQVQNIVPTTSNEVVEPNNAIDYDEIERKIRTGLIKYGGEDLPAIKQIPIMMEAIKKHDLFRNNPYLIPQQAILETSGGKNISYPNNLINYGIRSEDINKLFEQVGIDEALQRSAKEMGETGQVYKRFRTGKPLTEQELEEYAKQYEPTNPQYYHNLKEGLKYFESQ